MQRRSKSSKDERRKLSMHIQKAINVDQGPSKTKHIRAIVLASFEYQSSAFIYTIVKKFPLRSNAELCFKSLCLIYKLLHSGHPECVKDALRFGKNLFQLQSTWIKSIYPISDLCGVLVRRLRIHQKYPVLNGKLELNEKEGASAFDALSDHLIQFLNDLMNLAEKLTKYKDVTIHSINKSGYSIYSPTGQLIICPILICLEDATSLHNLIIKLMFDLHKKLGNNALEEHRIRFDRLYQELKTLYQWASSNQYIHSIVSLPFLPDKAPNFCTPSDAHSGLQLEMVDSNEEASGDEDDDMVAADPWLDGDAFQQTSEWKAFETTSILDWTSADDPFGDNQDGFGAAFASNESEMETEFLRAEIERLKSENNEQSESLLDRIRTLEEQIKEAVQLKSTQDEHLDELKSTLKRISMELESKSQKFEKFKEIYTDLREEHVKTLRDLTKARECEKDEKRSAEDLQNQVTELECQVSQLAEKEALVDQLRKDVTAHKAECDAVETRLDELKQERDSLHAEKIQLTKAVEDYEDKIKSQSEMLPMLCANSIEQFEQVIALLEDHALFVDVKGNPELFANHLKIIKQQFDEYEQIPVDLNTTPPKILPIISKLCPNICQALLHGRYLVGPNPDSGNFHQTAVDVARTTKEYLTHLQTGKTDPEFCPTMQSKLDQLSALVQRQRELNQGIKSDESELEDEMRATFDAIKDATALFQQWISSAPPATLNKNSGIDRNILQHCSNLMAAICDLILKAQACQKSIKWELPKEGMTYKRHHRWKQGLVSAAKSVGACANVLVEVADGLMSGRIVESERLLVVAREIAASTAQLTMASRVKLPPTSTELANMQVSSNTVIKTTDDLVKCVESSAHEARNEDADFNGLTFTQARRLEMESQVRVLQLESNVEAERTRLLKLRKLNYRDDTEVELEPT